jgi:hypothetical protein
MIAATGLCATGARAAEITYKAVGTINAPSPLAGEFLTVFFTFDPLVPDLGGPCGFSRSGFIPPEGALYPLAIKSVTYSIAGAPAVSLGTINNDPNDPNGEASRICLASDTPTQISGQNGYANVYDASANSITGYGLEVSVIAQSFKRVVIVPGTELITDRPNLPLFARDLLDDKISGSALIYLTYDNGIVVTSVAGAPATLSSITQVEGLAGPTVVPTVAGTMGSNGWYVSHPTTLSWAVSGKPVPAKSGCTKVTVPDTAGTSYTCTATNEVGDASDTVLIKKDSVAPAIQLKKPANNVAYAQNQKVAAAYSCTDATSGVASCSGSVAVGANIPTTTLGVQTFSVTAMDNAGNSVTKSVSYSVDPPAATPVFSLKPGTYPGPKSVTITDATASPTIYYTLDGSVPTTSSSVYSGAIPISVSETLKAIAEAPGFTRSAVRSAAYTIQ